MGFASAWQSLRCAPFPAMLSGCSRHRRRRPAANMFSRPSPTAVLRASGMPFSPGSRQAAAINCNDSLFAVTNLSPQAQSVSVSLYDQAGNLIAQKSTPLLAAGTQNGAQVTPGGVYGIDFGSFFGLTSSMLAPLSGTINGTVQFV